jgi:ketosteroid isomerase-like protein
MRTRFDTIGTLGLALGAPMLACAVVVSCDRQLTSAREETNDVETLTSMLPPEFVGIGFGGGAFDTQESALKGAADFASSGGRLLRLEFRDDRIQVFGDVATMLSNYTIEFEAGGTTTRQSGRATEVFVRRGGRRDWGRI